VKPSRVFAWAVAAVSLMELFLSHGIIPNSVGSWLYANILGGASAPFLPGQMIKTVMVVFAFILLTTAYASATRKSIQDINKADGSTLSGAYLWMSSWVLDSTYYAVVSAAGGMFGLSLAMLNLTRYEETFPLKPIFWGFVFAHALAFETGWGRPKPQIQQRPHVRRVEESEQVKITDY
jgi:hypothetical protein